MTVIWYDPTNAEAKKSKTHPNILKRIQETKDKGLDALDLSYETTRIELNQIPSEVFELTHLRQLNLGNQQFTTLPDRLGQLTNLITLYLSNNPIDPPEVLDLDSRGQANIENIRNYFRQLQEEGMERLYEAKLLIVGEAGAGKTTLAKKINDPAYLLASDEASTEGIEGTLSITTPPVQETAAWALHKLAPDIYQRHVADLAADSDPQVVRLAVHLGGVKSRTRPDEK